MWAGVFDKLPSWCEWINIDPVRVGEGRKATGKLAKGKRVSETNEMQIEWETEFEFQQRF